MIEKTVSSMVKRLKLNISIFRRDRIGLLLRRKKEIASLAFSRRKYHDLG